jgi:hypothetical protein
MTKKEAGISLAKERRQRPDIGRHNTLQNIEYGSRCTQPKIKRYRFLERSSAEEEKAIENKVIFYIEFKQMRAILQR